MNSGGHKTQAPLGAPLPKLTPRLSPMREGRHRPPSKGAALEMHLSQHGYSGWMGQATTLECPEGVDSPVSRSRPLSLSLSPSPLSFSCFLPAGLLKGFRVLSLSFSLSPGHKDRSKSPNIWPLSLSLCDSLSFGHRGQSGRPGSKFVVREMRRVTSEYNFSCGYTHNYSLP